MYRNRYNIKNIYKKPQRIVQIFKSLIRRLRDAFKLCLFRLMFWDSDFFWLYRNRYLRMDAKEPINDKKRRAFHVDRYDFAVKYLKGMNKDSLMILDIACGTGYGSDILKILNPKLIIGVDIDSETIRYASKKYGSERCVFKIANAIDMKDFRDKMFDAIISFETIEHLEDPILFLENINRLLKNKGILIMSTPNKWGLNAPHKVDYNYDLLKCHLKNFFYIESIYSHNSGSMDLWVNKGVSMRRLVKAHTENIEEAECFIAVCKK